MADYAACEKTVREKHPGKPMCGYQNCVDAQPMIDATCHDRGWQGGTPYWVPNFQCKDCGCYCCCSCFAYNTPIAVSKDEFKFIQDFRNGDTVLAAGKDLKWEPKTVAYSSGMGPASKGAYMVYILYGSSDDPQFLIVTEDHLFLTPEGDLVPANTIKPGEFLVSDKNKKVPVIFAVAGNYDGGVHHISTGPFDGKNLDGHLLNSNGVVSADFDVQIRYFTGSLDKKFLVKDYKQRLTVASAEYQGKHLNAAATAFITNPLKWPRDFRVQQRVNLVNVPDIAAAFFSPEQAEALETNKKIDRLPYTSPVPTQMIQYLYSLYRNFFNKPIYLVDWNNETPNAYSWSANNQDVVLLTGGFLRIAKMDMPGFAIVIAHHLAALYGKNLEKPEKIDCVGVADYYGVRTYMSILWRDILYGELVFEGFQQIKELFGYIPEVKESTDKCKNPTLACRLDTIQRAGQLMKIPDCANPDVTEFQLVKAFTKVNSGVVTVEFNEKLNIATAETVDNYVITPKVKVTGAKIKKKDFKSVALNAMIESTETHRLTVVNVLNEFDQPLAAGKNSVDITIDE